MSDEINVIDLHNRLDRFEGWRKEATADIEELKKQTAFLEKSTIRLSSDVAEIRSTLSRADAARDRQTDTLLDAINDTRKRALNQVPTWASTAITILTALCAALVTAFYHG